MPILKIGEFAGIAIGFWQGLQREGRKNQTQGIDRNQESGKVCQ